MFAKSFLNCNSYLLVDTIHQMFNANYWLRSVIIVCPSIHMSTSCFRLRPIVVSFLEFKDTQGNIRSPIIDCKVLLNFDMKVTLTMNLRSIKLDK